MVSEAFGSDKEEAVPRAAGDAKPEEKGGVGGGPRWGPGGPGRDSGAGRIQNAHRQARTAVVGDSGRRPAITGDGRLEFSGNDIMWRDLEQMMPCITTIIIGAGAAWALSWWGRN